MTKGFVLNDEGTPIYFGRSGKHLLDRPGHSFVPSNDPRRADLLAAMSRAAPTGPSLQAQVTAILKQLNQDNLDGKPLIAELDQVIGRTVKQGDSR